MAPSADRSGSGTTEKKKKRAAKLTPQMNNEDDLSRRRCEFCPAGRAGAAEEKIDLHRPAAQVQNEPCHTSQLLAPALASSCRLSVALGASHRQCCGAPTAQPADAEEHASELSGSGRAGDGRYALLYVRFI